MIMVLMNGAYVALQVAMGILHLYMYVCARTTLTREGDVVATVADSNDVVMYVVMVVTLCVTVDRRPRGPRRARPGLE